ncbi:MAG: hypothetical protein NTZ32_25125 [Planctomycetales bacterium]|nr:hypothetical protein [Planctomycetales bacterium]
MASKFKLVSRVDLIEGDSGDYAHPAIVGDRLYLRSSSGGRCCSLK